MSNGISRNPTLPKWMLCTYNHGIHVCSMYTYLKPFWKKTLWKHHPKTRTNGGRHELPQMDPVPGPSWRTPSPSTISPLPYWPSLSSGRVRFWEISPPKKGPITFLAKGTLSGSLKSSENFWATTSILTKPSWAWQSSSDRKMIF